MTDLRYAIRQLCRSPGFTAVALITLALGIGANTTVFCWIQNVLLRPWPGVARQEQMVVVCSVRGRAQFDTVSYLDIRDLRALTNIFEGIIGSQVTPASLKVDGRSEWIYGQITTVNFFDVLGVKPIRGRAFLSEEETKPGGHPVMVLSYGFWQRRFSGRPEVVGQTVELNGRTFTIVGVAPPEFQGTMSALRCDFWAPVAMHAQVANFGSMNERGDRWLHTQARLRSGVSLAKGQAAVDLLAQQLEAGYPATNTELRFRILPPWKSPYGGQGFFLPVMSILLAVALGVLLIVAANIANLLLVRATVRTKEIAIRLAMGAGRLRLMRQLLTESVLLALLGGAVGMLVAHWGSGLLLLVMPNTYLPVGYQFELDGKTLGFTILLSLLTGLGFGLAPALRASKSNLSYTLREGGRTSDPGTSHHGLRNALVATEIALALLLLVGAGLCIKGFQKARQVDPGFDPRQLLLGGLRIGMHGYNEQTGMAFYRQLRQQLASLPGVKDVALASWFPLGFEGGPGMGVNVEGYQPARAEDMTVPYAIVSPNYFATMRIRLIEGRDFTDADDLNQPVAVIINEHMAHRFWPGQHALGRKLRVRGNREATVVGIVQSGKYRSLNEPPKPFLYVSYQQGAWDLNLGVVMRGEGDPEALAAPLRQEIHRLDSAVELWAVIPYADFIQAAYLASRIASSFLAVLGFVALALSALGVYGIMAFSVQQRAHEIGVRMALGAGTKDIYRMVVGQGVRLTAIGGALGLIGALLASRWLSSFLYGISPFDPLIYAGVALGLGSVAMLACFLPAFRATRVDPVVALRCE